MKFAELKFYVQEGILKDFIKSEVEMFRKYSNKTCDKFKNEGGI